MQVRRLSSIWSEEVTPPVISVKDALTRDDVVGYVKIMAQHVLELRERMITESFLDSLRRRR